jgi:hypothetical protein
MSAQSFVFNPRERTLAATGDGFSFPTMSTTQRLTLGLTATDAGMQVYDTTLQRTYLWTGAAWYAGAGVGPSVSAGIGSPEGVVTADPGSIYFDITRPGSPVQYVKGSGNGNTGWV